MGGVSGNRCTSFINKCRSLGVKQLMFGRSEVEAGRQMVDNGELGYYCSNYVFKLKFKVGHFYKLIKKILCYFYKFAK